MSQMWMVRAEGGTLYDAFRERSVAALGWAQLAPYAKPGVTREALLGAYAASNPNLKPGTRLSGASQVWRFVNEVAIGDSVVTYSPQNRTYLLGRVTGAASYHPEWVEEGMPLARPVEWRSTEVLRDRLGDTTRNSLGSTLTVFAVPPAAQADVLAAADGRELPSQVPDVVASDLEIEDPYADIESRAVELIKDLVTGLDWQQMQELVAGVLRAMGYKTQVSPPGSDRGKDIIASPDGFGFEHPRIVVEVKHRPTQQIGSVDLRSFLGGRHPDDRGLYVSTGGFSREAYYEAERASIPLVLWTLDHLVRGIIEQYEKLDVVARQLVPLRRMYWPT